MTATVVPTPEWLGIGWAPHTGRVRVLGSTAEGPHVVAVRTTGPGARCVVAKRYRDRSGGCAATAMIAIGKVLASDGNAPLAVPGVVGWDSQRSVLVQTLAPGRPLLTELQGDRWQRALLAVAGALVYLHGAPVRAGRPTGIADHLADLVRPHPRLTALAVPWAAPRLNAVIDVLEARAAAAAIVQASAIHRDVHARQMFVTGSQVWLVDWDLFARGDPALDVANFAVYLTTHLGRRGTAAATAFVDAYVSAGTDLSPRLPVFMALTYVRLIAKAWRLRRPGWSPRMRHYLAQAERLL